MITNLDREEAWHYLLLDLDCLYNVYTTKSMAGGIYWLVL